MLTAIDLPDPISWRGGWAALAAVCTARGWKSDVFATAKEWTYHDGGGNWACLRFGEGERAVLVGHDHEYSQTYFGEAAEYFGEDETDLLAGAPDWWRRHLALPPMGEWIGFVYGWDGQIWQRADYDLDDGFDSVGLVRAWRADNLSAYAKDAPGLAGRPVDEQAVAAMIAADADVTAAQVEAVAPGWDGEAGAAAARAFLPSG